MDYVSTSLGRIGFSLPRAYQLTDVYNKRDLVAYQSSMFVALRDGLTGIAPIADGVNFELFAGRGVPGESNAVWFAGTAVAGQGAGIVAGVIGSKAGDMYLNTATSDIYSAVAPDLWDWMINLISVQKVTASTIVTSTPGVSVQEAIDSKVNKKGDTMTGNLGIGNDGDETYRAMILRRLLNSVQGNAQYGIGTANSKPAAFVQLSHDGIAVNAMTLSDTGTSFTKPVSIAGGGTGAATVADARTALGLKSGALKEIQIGTVSILTAANDVSSLPIAFPVAFSGTPKVFLSISEGDPDARHASPSGESATGVTINVRNYNASVFSLNVMWMAIY